MLLTLCETAQSKQEVADRLQSSGGNDDVPVSSLLFALLLRNTAMPAEAKLETAELLLLDKKEPVWDAFDEPSGQFLANAACNQPQQQQSKWFDLLWRSNSSSSSTSVITKCDTNNNTVLHVACELGQLELVSFLRERLSAEDFSQLGRTANRAGELAIDLLFPRPVRPFDVKPAPPAPADDDQQQAKLKIHALLQQQDAFLVPVVFYHPDCLEHLPKTTTERGGELVTTTTTTTTATAATRDHEEEDGYRFRAAYSSPPDTTHSSHHHHHPLHHHHSSSSSSHTLAATRSSVSFKKPKLVTTPRGSGGGASPAAPTTVVAAAAAAASANDEEEEDEDEPWEGPTRLVAIMDHLRPMLSAGQLLLVDSFEECDRELIETVHSPKYVDFVYALQDDSRLVGGRPVHFSPLLVKEFDLDLDSVPKDTFVSKGSLKAAIRAAGSVVAAVDAVCGEQAAHRKAMCVVRPPGHHAGIEGIVPGATSCGFCLFNNVMIGVQHYLQSRPEKDVAVRVAIVDIDVHHGNGTEEIVQKYYDDHPPTTAPVSPMLFLSTHLNDSRPGKCDFYPGGDFGKENDLVRNVVNLPIKPRWRWKLDAVLHPRHWQDRFYSYHLGRSCFRETVLTRILPILRAYRPTLLIVSAGFDTANEDAGNCDLGGSEEDGHAVGLDLEREDFHWVAHQLSQFSNELCEGRMVSVLEGGYGKLNQETGDVDRIPLGRNVQSYVAGLSGLPFAPHETDPSEPLYFDTTEFYEKETVAMEQDQQQPAVASTEPVQEEAAAAVMKAAADGEEDGEEALGKLAAEYWRKVYDADPQCYHQLVGILQKDFAVLQDVLGEIQRAFAAASPSCVALLPGFNAFLPTEVHFPAAAAAEAPVSE